MASEVERIGEESRRYSERMVERMVEAKARREARSRELAEQSAAEMRQFWQEMAERAAEPQGPEHDRPLAADEQGRQGTEQTPPAGRPPEVEFFRLREKEIERPQDGELRGRQEAVVPPAGDSRKTAQSDHDEEHPTRVEQLGDIDPREAIARSIAARRRNDIVAPIDDDGDDEAKYYRRNSWLV